ncbi:MAG: cupredoxin domain-containing protein [Nitrosarchaeum sp.]|nr:cupredoxin domain-containing protein [Nitrosarchaeum sp.]
MMGNNMIGSGMMGQMQGQSDDIQTDTMSYVKMVDGIQIVTVHAKDFKFIPSEIHVSAGKTKFVMINDGMAEHEFVVYDASKKEIVDKAEIAEDEETIQANILFEIDHTPGSQSAESNVIDLKVGSYIIGCHVAGHYEVGMKGTLYVEE